MIDDLSVLMKRFPAVELSYETHHMKDSSSYDVMVAIPYGKKAFLWCTFSDNEDTWLLLELGRDKRVVKATPWFDGNIIGGGNIMPWSFGTLFYGVVLNDNDFVVEDIMQCRGILTHKLSFSEKLAFFREFQEKCGDLRIWLPWMKDTTFLTTSPILPLNMPYVVHHIQYRSLNQILPYVNVFPESKGKVDPMTTQISTTAAVYIEEKTPRCDLKKPQYKKPTVFEVRADVQFDIYQLYVTNGKPGTCKKQYYGLAYIPNYKTSVMMNGIFRNIKENRNLDALEESDDEEDFQDCRSNKYVDLEKCVTMECVFHAKFKRWVPVSSVLKSVAVVNMSKL